MNVTLIGRGEIIFGIGKLLIEKGFKIPLIVTAKEAPEYKITHNDLKEFADSIGAAFLYSPKVSKNDLSETLQESGRDIALSVNYTGILSQDIIDLFKHGVLNAHGGDLPRYKGNACQAWAIINGEEKIGLCVHKMRGDQLDEGKIIVREYLPININSRVGEAYHWMESNIPAMMVNAVELLSNDSSFFIEDTSLLPPETSLRCYPRLPEDGKINWNNPAEKILRLINASSEPFSGAFSYLEGKKIIIWRAMLENDNENFLGVPGQAASINTDQSVNILCANSKLKLTEIEYDGTRTKNVSSVIKSLRLRLHNNSH